jgi:hypothetical protein
MSCTVQRCYYRCAFGVELSELQAEEQLDLLYLLAGQVVKQNFINPKNDL